MNISVATATTQVVAEFDRDMDTSGICVLTPCDAHLCYRAARWETPRRLVIEWSADGTDYVGRGDVADEDFREQWGQLVPLFREAPRKLTRRASPVAPKASR